MDNFTHSLVGLAAAKAGLERVSPYATAVCVLAANLPDADMVTLFAGRYVYLEEHRGVSHSIVGTLALSVVFPLIFYGVERLLAFWRGREPRAKLKGLLLCSLALGASHPLLDWTNNYGVRPLLPWDARWLYGDLVFILDPWIWLLLGGAAFLLTAKTARKTSVWAVLGLVLTALILFLPGQRDMTIPLASRAVWLAGVVVLVLAYRFGVARRWGAAVAGGRAAARRLLLGRALAHALARRRAGATRREAVRRRRRRERAQGRGDADAGRPADVALRGGDRARDLPLRRVAARSATRARGVTSGATTSRRARRRKPSAAPPDDPRARVFLGFSRFPVATVRRGAGGEAVVQFVDIRFTEPSDRARSDSFTVEIPVAEK